MITAKEAREKVDTLATARGETEKKLIEQKVNEAIEKAEYYCLISGSFSEPTLKWLEKFGYAYEISDDQRDGSCLKVMW